MRLYPVALNRGFNGFGLQTKNQKRSTRNGFKPIKSQFSAFQRLSIYVIPPLSSALRSSMTQNPQVVQVTSGRFHQFDLARQLEKRGLLAAFYTGYPRWKLRNEGLPPDKIRTCPWLHVPWRAGLARGLRAIGLDQHYQHWDRGLIDRYAAWTMSSRPDVLVAMSGHGTVSGQKVQAEGGSWICVRGSTHVRHQEALLKAEHRRWGLPYPGRPPVVIAREEFEYAQADRIAVPSRQVWRTFVAQGLPESRLALVPYGVDLSRFHPVIEPTRDEFRIVFAGALSVRKGLGHLLQAFARFSHPRKKLLLAGAAVPETRALLQKAPAGVEWLGSVSQARLRELFSGAQVMVLPSVEEGLANVLGQALACGCPVIATEATGAADLFSDEVEGFIIPEPDAVVLADRLERLADDPELRRRMTVAGMARVRELGGWDSYGDKMEALIRSLSSRSRPS